MKYLAILSLLFITACRNNGTSRQTSESTDNIPCHPVKEYVSKNTYKGKVKMVTAIYQSLEKVGNEWIAKEAQDYKIVYTEHYTPEGYQDSVIQQEYSNKKVISTRHNVATLFGDSLYVKKYYKEGVLTAVDSIKQTAPNQLTYSIYYTSVSDPSILTIAEKEIITLGTDCKPAYSDWSKYDNVEGTAVLKEHTQVKLDTIKKTTPAKHEPPRDKEEILSADAAGNPLKMFKLTRTDKHEYGSNYIYTYEYY